MLDPDNHLPLVRQQYEAPPYPPCDPQDEHKRLARTWLEDLAMINHYCFNLETAVDRFLPLDTPYEL